MPKPWVVCVRATTIKTPALVFYRSVGCTHFGFFIQSPCGITAGSLMSGQWEFAHQRPIDLKLLERYEQHKLVHWSDSSIPYGLAGAASLASCVSMFSGNRLLKNKKDKLFLLLIRTLNINLTMKNYLAWYLLKGRVSQFRLERNLPLLPHHSFSWHSGVFFYLWLLVVLLFFGLFCFLVSTKVGKKQNNKLIILMIIIKIQQQEQKTN